MTQGRIQMARARVCVCVVQTILTKTSDIFPFFPKSSTTFYKGVRGSLNVPVGGEGVSNIFPGGVL